MKLCWFDDARLGVVREGRIHDVSSVLAQVENAIDPRIHADPVVARLAELKPVIEAAADREAGREIDEVAFLAPVARPGKIVGTPANYLKHVEEAEENREVFTNRYSGGVMEQGLFLKATSALVGPSQGVKLRFPDRRTDHEMELGVIIGAVASGVTEEEALDYVAGYTLALDMVVRGPEDRSFRKSVDSYAVAGPWMVTADEIDDPSDLDLSLSVGGELRQASNTRHMILSIAKQISWASQFYTLWPGDILMTGTCEGVAQVFPGDVMDCTIEGVGRMQVEVS